jgi:malate synthase
MNKPKPSSLEPLNVTHTVEGQSEILNDGALEFLSSLAAEFTPERDRLMEARISRQALAPGCCAR